MPTVGPKGMAPAPLLLLLASRRDFVKSMLDAGKVPTPQVLATFLTTLVQQMGPHVKVALPAEVDILKTGLAALGWSVSSNSPAAGSAPPQPTDVLAFLESALAKMLPDLTTARAAAAAAARALAEEQRELEMMEEEALDGDLSGKQQKALAASKAKSEQLRIASGSAAELVKVVEACLTSDELEAASEAEAARRDAETKRLAQLTKEAAVASAGGNGKGGAAGGRGSKGGGAGGGRGSGGRGGPSSDASDREARAAEAAARAAAKAAAATKAAEDAIAALRLSDMTLVDASELRKGGYVLLPVSGKEEPCRIAELTTSKTGKHGHAKISVTANDVASGRRVERNLRADERVSVPGKRWLMAIAPVEIE